MERTYIMLKPDALKRGVAGEIISRIERKGYKIVEAKTMQLGEEILKEHYAHIADKPFFPELVEYMTSGPVLAMIVEGPDVVLGMRILMAWSMILVIFRACINPNEPPATVKSWA